MERNIDNWANDTPDRIQICLNCVRKECVNCFDRKPKHFMPEITKRQNPGVAKPVIMCDKNTGEPIEEFPSMQEAARQLHMSATGIYYCLTGKYKSAGGFKWKLADKEDS